MFQANNNRIKSVLVGSLYTHSADGFNKTIAHKICVLLRKLRQILTSQKLHTHKYFDRNPRYTVSKNFGFVNKAPVKNIYSPQRFIVTNKTESYLIFRFTVQ